MNLNNPFAPVPLMLCTAQQSYDYCRNGTVPDDVARFFCNAIVLGLTGAVRTCTETGKPTPENDEQIKRLVREAVNAPGASYASMLATEVLDMTDADHARFREENGETMSETMINRLKQYFEALKAADAALKAEEVKQGTDLTSTIKLGSSGPGLMDDDAEDGADAEKIG